MPQEQILTHFEALLIEPEVPAVSNKQANPNRTADQVADIVPNDCRRGRDEHDPNDIDLMC